MQRPFDDDIRDALGADLAPDVPVMRTGEAELLSCFAVTDLAEASISAAGQELAALTDARDITVDRRLASMWFDRSLRPTSWALPSVWDPIAGDYPTADGWVRLHTNAPHHRDAALEVLGCAAEKESVAEVVAGWEKTALEQAVVGAGGAAAAMRAMDAWARHPQGQAVAAEPLIAWEETGQSVGAAQLEGLRVLDLTRVLAGPVATRFLAGFGADVLRIDPPWWSEPGVEPEVTVGKRRAGLDLTQSEDRAVFETLLAQADVLVHGYRPGALAGLGFDAERLQTLAPGMINVSLCAYGWAGPWANRRGFDSLVQMSCGIAAEGMQRKASERPVPLPVQALDHATGYLMAAAVLRAVRRRAQTGAVFSARLSLARTAQLLTSLGARDFEGAGIKESDQDLAASEEQTSWGPAQRLQFPLLMEGAEPRWRYPAGHLRIDPARW